MSESGPSEIPNRQQRERVISRLCEHFAADHIQADELERLIDRAHGARTVAELEALVSGLSVLVEQPGPVTPAPAPSRHVDQNQTIVAIMGGADRKGVWAPARYTRVFTLMGGAMLDFREVRLPPGTTEVHVAAVMGSVEILVPPGLRVASDGVGIMGSFEHAADTPADLPDDAPLLRVTGLALMGEVQITERFPGESPREARKRRKSDRARKRLERG